jgi:hypothetical protein
VGGSLFGVAVADVRGKWRRLAEGGAGPGGAGMSDEKRGELYPNTFQCPNLYVDQLLHLLTSDETKVLNVAVRETLGWHKRTQRIALSVFVDGKTKNGERVSHGTGLSRDTVRSALESLHKFNILIAIGSKNHPRGQAYTLQFDADKIDWNSLERRRAERDDANRRRTSAARRKSPALKNQQKNRNRERNRLRKMRRTHRVRQYQLITRRVRQDQ